MEVTLDKHNDDPVTTLSLATSSSALSATAACTTITTATDSLTDDIQQNTAQQLSTFNSQIKTSTLSMCYNVPRPPPRSP